MTDLVTKVTVVEPELDDDTMHFSCCIDGSLALCGLDLSAHTWRPLDEVDCVVCVDLSKGFACPRFGRCVH